MGINEQLEEIKDLLKEKEKEKEKKFKFPFGKKVGKSQKKNNYITLIKLNENGSADFKKVKIEEQTIMEDGVPRLASTDCVFTYKKNPMMILPSWSVEPISFHKHFQTTIEDNNNTNIKGYKILMNKMLISTTDQKKQMSGMLKWILIIGALGLIAYVIINNIGG